MNDFELMDVKAAADYLRLSKSSVYKLINQKVNTLPHIRLGSRVVFTKEFLNEYIQKNIVKNG
ncbi:MAG: helix-turn-helix domain-containing protein [Bacteroidales bacterium]|nr:helix-turn-helix domain-containing protein [Bacteroidales bacterium]MBO5853629.1 helix-turn-helix domain-containing protein [Bacteroidales bacterium]